jgi:hypothetical protein
MITVERNFADHQSKEEVPMSIILLVVGSYCRYEAVSHMRLLVFEMKISKQVAEFEHHNCTERHAIPHRKRLGTPSHSCLNRSISISASFML